MNLIEWLVPPPARGKPEWRGRHVGVAKALLTISATVIILLLLFLLVRPAPTLAEILLFAAAIVIPVLGALLIRRTGRIVHGLVLTNIAGVLLVTLWAYLTGGIQSVAIPWLLANLALLSAFGNMFVLIVTGSVLSAAVLMLYALTERGALPASFVPPAAQPVLLLLALLSSIAAIVFAATIVMRERVRAKARLRAARDVAEQASRAKSVFLSSMSHELRTPLSAVIGFAEVLKLDQAEPLSPAQASHVEHILNAGDHLLGLVNQVIEMSRIEAGDVELQIESVRVNEVIASALAMVELPASKRGIVIDSQLRVGAGLLVRADATRLKQVLLNLLSNAVKYNRENGKLGITVRQAENNRARIAVSDTGAGIAENRRGQLFQSFARLGEESGRIQGTGLGLTIAKRLTELMGGGIGFDSEHGVGSTFWIELPLAH